LKGQDLYRRFRDAGFEYGPSLQALQEVFLGEQEGLGRLALPDAVKAGAAGFLLHPSLLDAALQTTAAVGGLGANGGGAYLPFTLSRLEILRPVPEEAYAHVTRWSGSAADGLHKFDIDLLDGNGQVCVRLKELAVKALRTAAGQPVKDLLRQLERGELSVEEANKLLETLNV
jgi:polyketide synthase PksN